MANETIAFQLKPGARYAESSDSGVVIHVGGTASGKVYLTPQQALALKAGSPESIFEPPASSQGSEAGQVVGETGQTAQEGQEQAPSAGIETLDAQAEGTTQFNDAAVTAFLSKSVKDIASSLDGVHDAQFISQLHSKESASPKPRQAVIDALNTRYDALMAKG